MKGEIRFDYYTVDQFDMLEKAIKAFGFTVIRQPISVSFYAPHGRITFRDGDIQLDERDRLVLNKVKRQFTSMALKMAAAKCGWAFHQTGKNNFLLRKR